MSSIEETPVSATIIPNIIFPMMVALCIDIRLVTDSADSFEKS
jgi:hypothetical protein